MSFTNKKKSFLLLILGISFLMVGCARKLPSDMYYDNQSIEKYIYNTGFLFFNGRSSIKPGCLVIDMNERKIDEEIFFSLPGRLRPKNREDIKTVVLIDRESKSAGSYDDGASRSYEEVAVHLIDVETGTEFAYKYFESDIPDVVIFKKKDDTSPVGTHVKKREIKKYLRSFYDRELNEIKDQELLAAIASGDKYNEDVRTNAIKLLDPKLHMDMLLHIAKDNTLDSSMREEAVRKLDPTMIRNNLTELMKGNSRGGIKASIDETSMKATISEALGKESELAKWIETNSIDRWFLSRCLDALTKIKDQKIIAGIALNEKIAQDVQFTAIKHQLEDQELLKNIVNNKSTVYERLRACAASKINDQKYLKYLEKHEKGSVRYEAIAMIRDQAFLKRIIKEDADAYAKIAAYGLLRMQSQLFNMAKTEKSKPVRKKAIEKLDDVSMLNWLVKNDAEYEIRLAALKKLHNVNIDNPNTWLLLRKIKDQGILLDIAMNDGDDDISVEAVRNITDQKILHGLVMNLNKIWLRSLEISTETWNNMNRMEKEELENKSHLGWKAVSFISDQSLLVDIALNAHKSYGGRSIERIIDKGALRKIAENSKDTEIQNKAKERMKEL